MTFPVTFPHYDQPGQDFKIYQPAAKFPFYRVAFKAASQRRMMTFASYSEAKAAKEAAEAKGKELHKGQQSAGLTTRENQAAIAIRETLGQH